MCSLAAPASAEPGDDPCELATNFFCRFVPIAPHLEGDVDLTHSSRRPTRPRPPESLPPARPCSSGCI